MVCSLLASGDQADQAVKNRQGLSEDAEVGLTAALGFERDRTQFLSGDWSNQFFSKGFREILLGTFPRPAAMERGGFYALPAPWPLSGVPSPSGKLPSWYFTAFLAPPL